MRSLAAQVRDLEHRLERQLVGDRRAPALEVRHPRVGRHRRRRAGQVDPLEVDQAVRRDVEHLVGGLGRPLRLVAADPSDVAGIGHAAVERVGERAAGEVGRGVAPEPGERGV